MDPVTRTVTVAEAAELTGLTKTAIQRRIDRGTLPAVVRGGRRRVPVSELFRRGLATPVAAPIAPAGDGTGEAAPPTPGSPPTPAPGMTGAAGDAAGAAWAELLDRLERQAVELAALRGLPAQVETERRSREEMERAFAEQRLRADQAEAALAEARARMADLERAADPSPPAPRRRWWRPWARSEAPSEPATAVPAPSRALPQGPAGA